MKTLMTEIVIACPECHTIHRESKTEHNGRIFITCEKCNCKYVAEYQLKPVIETYIMVKAKKVS